jgi:4-amino-4-deoxy-L-arabinose transferase-like glycosyltransferase
VSATSPVFCAHSALRARGSLPWVLLTLAAVGLASLWWRPLLPVDETRYLAVAWEMWWRGDFILPWLNGEPYHHKPPLLFWLIHAGWAVFGVNEVWPRLISPIAALLGALALHMLARQLWPERPEVAEMAPVLGFGSFYLLAYSSALMFDTVLLALLLAAWTQLHRMLGAPTLRDALLLLLWASLALLCKGPVALIHLLAPLLTWPLWRAQRGSSLRPLLAPLSVVMLSVLPLLLWALAASDRGGEAFRQALIFGQTLDRVSGAMGHPRPFWFYLPFLLLLPLPWTLWPRAWKALYGLGAALREPPTRFLLAILMTASAVHLLVSGKQVHYLIPMLALGLLLLARLLPTRDGSLRSAQRIALAGGGALVLSLALAGPRLAPRYPLQAIGEALAKAEAADRTSAYVGHYQGEFQFAGRLRRPVTQLSPDQVAAWVRTHPNGLLFAREKRLHGDMEGQAEARFNYKGTPLWLLPATAFVDGRVQASTADADAGAVLPLGLN